MNSTNTWGRLIKKYFVLILLGIFTLVLAINFLFYKKDLNHTGVYIIAKITDADFSARGTIYTYEFFFRGKKYESRVKSGGLGKGDLIFIKTLPDKPDASLIQASIKVPYCLTMQDVPFEGWKKIPKDTCK